MTIPIPSFMLPLAALGALPLPQNHSASGKQDANDVGIVAARTARMTVLVRITD